MDDLKSELAALWELVEADRKTQQDYFLMGMWDLMTPRKIGEGKCAVSYKRGTAAALDAAKNGIACANSDYHNPRFRLDDRIPSDIHLPWATSSECRDLANRLGLQTDEHFKTYIKIFNERYIAKLKELVSSL